MVDTSAQETMRDTSAPPPPPSTGSNSSFYRVVAAVAASSVAAFAAGFLLEPAADLAPPSYPHSPPKASDSTTTTIVRERHVNFLEPTYDDPGSEFVAVNPLSATDRVDPNLPLDAAANGVSASGSRHLTLDIKGIDSYFLSDPELLSEAIGGAAERVGLTSLSFLCHLAGSVEDDDDDNDDDDDDNTPPGPVVLGTVRGGIRCPPHLVQ